MYDIIKAEEFYKAWEFLFEHKIFQGHFRERLYIMVVKVNPFTNMVDDDDSKNIKVEIWLETGPYGEPYSTHDWDLDCGGNTFEDAIIKLASLVKKYYDDSGVKKSNKNVSITEEKEDGSIS